MALQFIIGRSGTGKTRAILEQIKHEIKQDPFGPSIILLTPEQMSFQMEYGLIEGDLIKGSLRAQGLSFRRLAYRVMQESGGTALTPISDTGKAMLLYKLVAEHEDELKLYRMQAGQTGFAEKMVSMFKEWKRYGLDVDKVSGFIKENESARSKQLNDKLHDLAFMYKQLEYTLQQHYMDEEQQLQFLIDGVSSAYSLQNCHIFMDGFHGLTPLEYEALGALMKVCKNITIALTLDRHIERDEKIDELHLFHQTAEAYKTITELAISAGVEIAPPIILQHGEQTRYSQSPALSFLEQHFQRRKAVYEYDVQEQLDIVSAVNRRAEVEAVCRSMLQQVRQKHYRWNEMAIYVRNLEQYRDYLEIAAKDYDIPIYLDMKQKPLYHPFIEFLRGASETLLSSWSYDAVFRMVKTEYLVPLEANIPRVWFDKLENYVLATGIQGWKWLDLSYWKPQAQVSLDEEEEFAYTITEEAEFEHNIALLTRECIVNPIVEFDKKLNRAKNVKEQCLAVYELLMYINAPYRLEQASEQDHLNGQIMMSRTHKQLWAKVMQMLDEFVELCGEDRLSTEMFLGMLETGLDSLTLVTIPPTIDQVMVADMEHSRLENIKISYVLGASDGVMPMRMSEDSLLTELEREALASNGFMLAPSSRRKLLDERFVIYNTLCKPSEKLWISYPLADEEGKSIVPSEIIRQLKIQFPQLSVKMMLAEPNLTLSEDEQLSYLAHPNKAMSNLIVMLRHWYTGETIPQFWWDVYNFLAQRPAFQSRLKSMLMSLDYSNIEQPLLKETADELFGSHLRMSVSRVERFVSCPFQHFSIYGLKLRKRKQHQLAAPDMGQLFHAALGKLTNELGHSFGRTNQEKVKATVNGIVDQLIPRLNSSILLSNERFKYIARKLKQIVEQAAVIINEHGGRATFTPIGTEVDFGPRGVMPSLIIPLNEGKQLEIIGRIDRIDSAQTADGLLIRIMDYKSSDTTLKLEQVVHGLSLQMLTYLDVLMTHGESWLKQKITPAGVLYFHVHNPTLNVAHRISQDEAEAALFKEFKMRGLLLADTNVVREMDTELDTGFSKMLPVAINKDETFRSGSSVVSREEWDVLRQFVRKKIKQIGSNITEGKIAIEPYQLGDKTPCQYCDYKAFCQFDQALEGNQYRKLRKCDQNEVWQQLREEDSNESSSI